MCGQGRMCCDTEHPALAPSAVCVGPAFLPQERIAEVKQALLRARLPFGAKAAAPMDLEAYEFKHDKRDYNVYWDVRKGLIPIVGGARETGAGGALPPSAQTQEQG